MGRKWTNISFVFDRNAVVPEATATQRTQEEVLYEYLRERWDDENVSPRSTIDVSFGNPSQDKLERWLGEIVSENPFIKEAGVVFVTDSANIGYGSVYEFDDENEPVLVDEYSGYEGAFGEDVSGMISDDHHIRVSAEWCWG